MKINDVKIGEDYRVEQRSYRKRGERVRVEAIEKIEEKRYGWSSSPGRTVRKLRVTEVHPETGVPFTKEQNGGSVNYLLPARELEGLWSEYKERYDNRRTAEQFAHARDRRIRDALDRITRGTFPGQVHTRFFNAEEGDPHYETTVTFGGWNVKEYEVETFIESLVKAGENG